MSTITCTCGHVISDRSQPSPTEGILFSETAFEQFLTYAGRTLSLLKQAESEGTRSAWIISELGETYPDDASDSEVIEDLLSREMQNHSVSVTRCESCRRIHLQDEVGSTKYSSFAPDVE